MATGTRAMANNRVSKIMYVAALMMLVRAGSISASASDASHPEGWKTVQSGGLAYLNGDGGGEEKATVCNSIEGAVDVEVGPGCKAHPIGSLVTIGSKTGVNDPLTGLPVVTITGHGFSGYIEATMLEPAIPRHTRFRVESKIVGLFKHLESMNPFVDDLTLKRGVYVEVLAQVPYRDGMWVKLLILDGKDRGFIGWANPTDLDIFFH